MNETLLVCDDDEMVLRSTACMLETEGYSVVRALSGKEALEASASHDGTIELLLTDVVMPEMNGWELAEKLAEQRPGMKVIFMSGYSEGILRLGAPTNNQRIEVLRKPLDGDTMCQRIRETLDDDSQS